MSRHVIAKENVETVDGRLVRDFVWDSDDYLPLMVQTTASTLVVGRAANLKREGDLITAELIPAVLGLGPQIDTDNLEFDETASTDGLMVVKRARIRAVTMGPRPAWPDLIIERAD